MTAVGSLEAAQACFAGGATAYDCVLLEYGLLAGGPAAAATTILRQLFVAHPHRHRSKPRPLILKCTHLVVVEPFKKQSYAPWSIMTHRSCIFETNAVESGGGRRGGVLVQTRSSGLVISLLNPSRTEKDPLTDLCCLYTMSKRTTQHQDLV